MLIRKWRRRSLTMAAFVTLLAAGPWVALTSPADAAPTSEGASVQAADLSVSPTAVDVTTSAQTVTLRVHLTNSTGSAVTSNGVYLTATAPDSGSNGQMHGMWPTLAEGTATDGIWQGQMTFEPGDQPGNWTINLSAWDTNDNQSFAWGLGSVAVTNNGNYDGSPPQPSDVTVSPSTVDVTSEAQTVTLRMRLTDSGGSTVDTAGLYFYATAPDANFNGQAHDANPTLVEGTDTDGIWQGQMTFQPGDEPGNWPIKVGVLDTNGNSATYPNLAYISVASLGSTPPDSPADVTAMPGNGRASVTWTAAAANGSLVTRYVVTASPGGASATTSGATTASVSGLTNGTAYTFTVTATNAIGTSAPSVPSSAVTPVGPPAPPTIGAPSAGNASAVVRWTAPASNGGKPITGYIIRTYRGTTVVKTSIAAATATSSTVTGLTNGTAYRFTVSATNALGAGPASTQSAVVTPATKPATPTIGAPSGGNASAVVRWTAPASNGGKPITGYTIRTYRGTTLVKTTTAAATATSATIAGLTNGTAYTFTVSATNALGAGPASAHSSAAVPAVTRPVAPRLGTPFAGHERATVRWTAPVNNGGKPITGYTIRTYRGTTAVKTTTAAATATSTLVTGLTNGTAYTFTVAATNALGTGPASAHSSEAIPHVTPPDAPRIVSTSAGYTTATIHWTDPANDGGCCIIEYTVRTYRGTSLVKTTTAREYSSSATITGLTNGAAYTFTVAATNFLGTGAYSAHSAAVTPGLTKPGVPFIIEPRPANTAAVVRWGAPVSNGGKPITGYVIRTYRGTTLVKTTTAGATAISSTVTGLTNGTAYTFTVAATNAKGTGSASARSVAIKPNPFRLPTVVQAYFDGCTRIPGSIGVRYHYHVQVSGGSNWWPAGGRLSGSVVFASGVNNVDGLSFTSLRVFDAYGRYYSVPAGARGFNVTYSDYC